MHGGLLLLLAARVRGRPLSVDLPQRPDHLTAALRLLRPALPHRHADHGRGRASEPVSDPSQRVEMADMIPIYRNIDSLVTNIDIM